MVLIYRRAWLRARLGVAEVAEVPDPNAKPVAARRRRARMNRCNRCGRFIPLDAGPLCETCAPTVQITRGPAAALPITRPPSAEATATEDRGEPQAIAGIPAHRRDMLIRRPSELHAAGELAVQRAPVLERIGPEAARRRTAHRMRRAKLRKTLLRIGLVLGVLVLPLSAGGLLALVISSIR